MATITTMITNIRIFFYNYKAFKAFGLRGLMSSVFWGTDSGIEQRKKAKHKPIEMITYPK